MMWIQYISTAIMISICGFIYVHVLTKPSGILSGWAKFISKTVGPLRKKGEIKWIHKPILSCDFCVTGQVALWIFLIRFDLKNYDILNHIGFICLSIFVVVLIKTVLNGRSKNGT